MGVCLKCGKAIEPGKNYCNDCGLEGKAQVDRLFAVVEGSTYEKKRTSSIRWIAVFLVLIMSLMGIIAFALITMMPSGPEFASKAKAGICRSNMRRIDEEIRRYYQVENEYPPVGPVDDSHPLLVDRYLKEPPKCPTTGHHYVLVSDGNRVVVTCDSGDERHRI